MAISWMEMEWILRFFLDQGHERLEQQLAGALHACIAANPGFLHLSV
jgi:hypothetical protein